MCYFRDPTALEFLVKHHLAYWEMGKSGAMAAMNTESVATWGVNEMSLTAQFYVDSHPPRGAECLAKERDRQPSEVVDGKV